MKIGTILATLLVVPMFVLSAWTILGSQGAIEPQDSTIQAELPEYTDGYGFDAQTGVMEDTNGFRYSYRPDGIVQLDLPWGYRTHFSFGLTADYLGSPEKRTALDYAWTWDTVVGVALNETGGFTGYTYTFTADNLDGILDWRISLEFSPTDRMKVTHTLENGYTQDLTNVNFWWVFDLTGTTTPYSIETSGGAVEGPLYQAIPDGTHWVRLANQFQFDWRDALVDYENGNAYIGDGSVVGLDGLPILGISIEIGDIAPGGAITVDPYFSGVELTWDANADGLASSPSNWDPVQVPDAGDNVTFDGTSTYNCNWNLEITLGNFSMLNGYTGTVTQTIDFGCVDVLLQAGTFKGGATNLITCEGDFIQNGGSLTTLLTNLNLTGEDYHILSRTQASYFLHIYINDVVNVTSVIYTGGISVSSGSTLDIKTGADLDYYQVNGMDNQGVIAGAGEFRITGHNTKDSYFWNNGTITVSVFRFYVGSSVSGNRTHYLGGDFSLGSTTTYIQITHASYTFTFHHNSNYSLTSSGTVVVSHRVIIVQGASVWSFGYYTQSGTDSVFNQGGALTVSNDFTISAGEFVGSDDAITVGGDWNTDGYTHGDNVVTLTGASKTLDMAATESFYNITVSGTYTMDADTTVDLRATITGTVSGSGDFIEPEPEFTSEGVGVSCPGVLYEYEVTQAYWDALAIYDGPYWLRVVDDVVTGVPLENDTGVISVSLTLTWNDMTTYQNYTLIVCPEPLSEVEITILGVVLSLVLGFGLLAIGITRNEPVMMVYSGLIWVFSGIIVYKDINLGWAILSMCLGMVFLWTGGLQIGKDSEG